MSPDSVEIRVTVVGEDDPVRDERAACGLRDELLARDGVLEARFASTGGAPPPGAKGPAVTETAVIVTTVASSATPIVVAFIRAWAERAPHRRVAVSVDGSFEVHGGIGREEARIVRALRDADPHPPAGELEADDARG
jgi:hypothetical protein